MFTEKEPQIPWLMHQPVMEKLQGKHILRLSGFFTFRKGVSPNGSVASIALLHTINFESEFQQKRICKSPTMKYVLLISILFLMCNVYANTDQKKMAKNYNERKPLTEQKIIDLQDSSIKKGNEINVLLLQKVKDTAKINKATEEKRLLDLQINSLKDAYSDKIDNTDIQSDRLSYGILVFGLLLIISILVFQLFRRERSLFYTFKLIGIMFIGTISVFLIPAGFDNEQITPVVGLLGTLAGYLVGSTPNPDNKADTT